MWRNSRHRKIGGMPENTSRAAAQHQENLGYGVAPPVPPPVCSCLAALAARYLLVMGMFSPAPRLVAVLGPTNTGKTHLDIERMLGHKSGMIGFPLRLLARENYARVV